jgi:putative nucleotidyltransferase with HDIG domain
MSENIRNNEKLQGDKGLINPESVNKSYIHYLQNIRNLPSIPNVIFEVSRLLDDPMTNASDLAALISRDQGMVTKILTVANSPFYGLTKKISTIEFAIVILGFENIKNIIIALSMMGALKGSGKNWDRKKYWYHCLAVASMAKRLAEDLGYSKSGEAFTAGLLHDLGLAIIQLYLNNESNKIYELVNSKQINFLEAETEILNGTHQEIGNFLAEKWNLPQPLSDSILFHHNPGQSTENKFLVSIIHLADYLSWELDFGKFEWDRDIKLDFSIIDVLGWGSEVYVYEFIESYREIFQNKLEPIIE